MSVIVEQIVSADGFAAEPIARLPKLVVSSTLERAPWGDGEIEVVRPDPTAADAVRALQGRIGSIIVWGSLSLANALLEADLVGGDEGEAHGVRTAEPLAAGDGEGRPAAAGARGVEHRLGHGTDAVHLPAGTVRQVRRPAELHEHRQRSVLRSRRHHRRRLRAGAAGSPRRRE